jgi:hypothetical protein
MPNTEHDFNPSQLIRPGDEDRDRTRRESLLQQIPHWLIIGIICLLLIVAISTGVWWANNSPNSRPCQIVSYDVWEMDKTTAAVTWVTDKPSTSQVMYCGLDNKCQVTEPDTTKVTRHIVIIKDMVAGVNYHMTIKSIDIQSLGTTKEFEFRKAD